MLAWNRTRSVLEFAMLSGDVDGELSEENIADCDLILVTLYPAAAIEYLETKAKEDWYDMIQLLPSSYNQMRTCTLNYETLINIYHARRNHKLAEWHTYCDWIETLPYAKELICFKKEDDE